MDSSKQIHDIRERTFEFSVRVVKLCRLLEKNSEVSNVLVKQLLASATSIGANLEEAQAGQSKADFIHKNSISLKEARETRYWLRLIRASTDFGVPIDRGIGQLETEADEIARIIGAIVVSAKG